MPLYAVNVANKESGREYVIRIEAADEDAVRRATSNLGLLAGKVTPEKVDAQHPDTSTTMASIVSVLLMVIGTILIMLGILNMIGDPSFHRNRFDNDYAPGATANALEKMAGAASGSSAMVAFGLGFIGVGCLISINANVRSIHDRRKG